MVRDRQTVARHLVRRGGQTDILMAAALGDTPYDAIAAAKAGIGAIAGTLTGGFPRAALQAAGCRWIVESAVEILSIIHHRQLVDCG